LEQNGWRVLKFPAIAEEDETHVIKTRYGTKTFKRSMGEPLHPERESLEILAQLREIQGEYNFTGQFQQAPARLVGGMVKVESGSRLVPKFNYLRRSKWSFRVGIRPTSPQSWAISVCTTWGIREKHFYLLNVFRKRLGYPELKRAVREQAEAFNPSTILIEDKASGTQLIQELAAEGMYTIKKYEPAMHKTMRLASVTGMIENGFVHLPDKAVWLAEYLHEVTTFPNGKYDDQTDSTSQALEWFKSYSARGEFGLIEYLKNQQEKIAAAQESRTVAKSMVCSGCNGVMSQPIPSGLRCAQCGAQWPPPGMQQVQYPTRTNILNGVKFGRF
jgi:predicted phage terminase large subunit-like protein